MNDSSHITPNDKCPACGYAVDRASGTMGGSEAPEPDDLSVCISCAALLQFGADLKLKSLPPKKFRKLPRETREQLKRAQQAIQCMRQRN